MQEVRALAAAAAHHTRARERAATASNTGDINLNHNLMLDMSTYRDRERRAYLADAAQHIYTGVVHNLKHILRPALHPRDTLTLTQSLASDAGSSSEAGATRAAAAHTDAGIKAKARRSAVREQISCLTYIPSVDQYMTGSRDGVVKCWDGITCRKVLYHTRYSSPVGVRFPSPVSHFL